MASISEAIGSEPPYRASLIDQFNLWVEKLPVRPWIFYGGFAVLLTIVQLLFLWTGRGLRGEELVPVIIFNGVATPFLLAQIHLLDHQAVSAAKAIRPMLDLETPECEQYEYHLSNMPFLPPLAAGTALMSVTLLTPLVSIEPIRYAVLEELPVFNLVFHMVDKSSAFLMGVFLYHAVRQLRLVSRINLAHIRINLFHLGPLQAFSRLTATTAVGLVAFIYVWMFINPELLADPVSFGLATGFTIFALALFVWPLYGVHQLMEAEKAAALRDIDLRFEAVITKFNQRLEDDDLAELERLNGTIASLEIQRKRFEAIPTWPWSPDTARFALTAIALPLILTILDLLLN